MLINFKNCLYIQRKRVRYFYSYFHRSCSVFLYPNENAKWLLVFSSISHRSFSKLFRVLLLWNLGTLFPMYFFHKALICYFLVDTSLNEGCSLHNHSLPMDMSELPLDPLSVQLAACWSASDLQIRLQFPVFIIHQNKGISHPDFLRLWQTSTIQNVFPDPHTSALAFSALVGKLSPSTQCTIPSHSLIFHLFFSLKV